MSSEMFGRVVYESSAIIPSSTRVHFAHNRRGRRVQMVKPGCFRMWGMGGWMDTGDGFGVFSFFFFPALLAQVSGIKYYLKMRLGFLFFAGRMVVFVQW